MQLIIDLGGQSRCIYGEEIDLAQLGELTIRRGSRVEPDSKGRWFCDMSPVGGQQLGPFPSRSTALAAEVAWLADNWLTPDR